jgi:undecaprenyl-diphosphatase
VSSGVGTGDGQLAPPGGDADAASSGTAPSPRGRWRGGGAAGLGALGLALVLLVCVLFAVDGQAGQADDGLSVGAAVLLGLVEGLTEWLPISSTGHLTMAQIMLGIEGDAATSYAIAIQAGAILAVLGLYRHRFTAMVNGVLGRDPAGRQIVVAIVAACLPAIAVGLTFEDVIKDRLFGAWPIVIAWFVGGLAILTLGRRVRLGAGGRPLTALTWRGGLVIGAAQILALWPGVSRSLVTILSATLVGLALPAAVEFSFLLGFVILGGATAYETISSGDDMVSAYGLAVPLLGAAVALVSAAGAMHWMVGYLNRRGLAIFGWYRIAVAGVAGVLLVTGVISST